jgi:hypothetical protein
VSVVIPLVVVELSVTDDGEKLQLLSDGRPEHAEGVRLIVPLKPFMAVNVSVVEPLLPGLGIVIVWLERTTLKSGAGVTVSWTLPNEGAYMVSPE